MNGALGEGVLPGLLRELYVGRKSGMLTLHRGPGPPGLPLPQRPHRQRRHERARGPHGRGPGPPRPPDRGRPQARDRVRGARRQAAWAPCSSSWACSRPTRSRTRSRCTCTSSWPRSSPGATGPTSSCRRTASKPVLGDTTLKVTTGELILEAARSVTDPDVVRYCLGDIDRILGLASDPLLRFQRVTLTPADGYVLSRVDGTLSAREIVAMISLPRDETHKSLFALLSTGMIEYLPLPPKPRPAEAKKPRPARADGGGAPRPSCRRSSSRRRRRRPKRRPRPPSPRRRRPGRSAAHGGPRGLHRAEAPHAFPGPRPGAQPPPRPRSRRRTSAWRAASIPTSTTTPPSPTCATRSRRSSSASARPTRCCATPASARSTRTSSTPRQDAVRRPPSTRPLPRPSIPGDGGEGGGGRDQARGAAPLQRDVLGRDPGAGAGRPARGRASRARKGACCSPAPT